MVHKTERHNSYQTNYISEEGRLSSSSSYSSPTNPITVDVPTHWEFENYKPLRDTKTAKAINNKVMKFVEFDDLFCH